MASAQWSVYIEPFLVAASDAPDIVKQHAHRICDGTADEVEIQAAIDEVSTVTGKVQLSEGTFTIAAPIQMKNGVYLEGRGRSSANPATGTIVRTGNNPDYHMITLGSTGVQHCGVRDMVLDGRRNQASPAGSVDCIHFDWTGTSLTNAPRVLLEHIWAFRPNQHGFHIVQPSGAGGGACDLIGCICSSAVVDGFRIDAHDPFLTHCIALLAGERGFFLGNGSAAHMTACKADSCGQITAANGEGLYISGAAHCKIGNFEALLNTRAGIRVLQDNCVITGAYLRNNGQTAAKQPSLKLGGGVDGLVVEGLLVMDDDGVVSYGVEIGDGAQNLFLSGAIKGADTGKVDDQTASPPAPNFQDNLVNW